MLKIAGRNSFIRVKNGIRDEEISRLFAKKGGDTIREYRDIRRPMYFSLATMEIHRV